MTLSRRDLFGMFRRPVSAPGRAADTDSVVTGVDPAATAAATGAGPPIGDAPPAFSLDAFYAGRTGDGTLPAFAIRASSTAATSRIGSGPTLSAQPATARTPPASTASSAATASSAPAAATPVAPALVPEVLPHRCLATRSFCSVCIEHCPVPGAIVTDRGRPRVVPALCDGCGRCIAACPAPILAFALVPRSTKGLR